MALRSEPTILLVDDNSDNLDVLAGLLQPFYKIFAANTGAGALRVAARTPIPDLILLDIMMPGLDGFDVLARLREDPVTRKIPVVFITALSDSVNELRGLALGAADYITKPFQPQLVLSRVRGQIEAKQARDWMKNQNALLKAEVDRRMIENDLTQQVSIRALPHLAETRDPETGNHILRTQGYVRQLATRLKGHPRFAAVLSHHYIDLLARSAPLHDIGKVGIPDHILLKPGKLTADEWEVMKTHARQGSDAIENAEQDIAQPLAFLLLAKEIARWHHEKWDGSGYPDGLAGDAIPLSARLMAIADVFDALISRRVYKPAMDYHEVRKIIADGRGQHFDPDITDEFLAGFSDFTAIAESHRDGAVVPIAQAKVSVQLQSKA